MMSGGKPLCYKKIRNDRRVILAIWHACACLAIQYMYVPYGRTFLPRRMCYVPYRLLAQQSRRSTAWNGTQARLEQARGAMGTKSERLRSDTAYLGTGRSRWCSFHMINASLVAQESRGHRYCVWGVACLRIQRGAYECTRATPSSLRRILM